jgi:hypothetical protein
VQIPKHLTTGEIDMFKTILIACTMIAGLQLGAAAQVVTSQIDSAVARAVEAAK